MSLEQALKTEGWMLPEELVWLNEKAKLYPRIVEVGSYAGRSTLALAEYALFVVAIDDWKSANPQHTTVYERETSYQKFMTNLDTYIKAEVVIPLRIGHRQVEPRALCMQPPFDMVFIDGDHNYGQVRQDIVLWKGHVRKGGLLCGHDYTWEGVARAVDELLPAKQIVAGSIWSVEI